MRDIFMERVNETGAKILKIIESPVLTHEQKLMNLANQAEQKTVPEWRTAASEF